MGHWDTLNDDRDPPEVVVLRTASALRLCMVTEYYYSSGGPYPYGDACVYSLFSDRDISEDVMAFLHNRADASRWRFSDKVLRAEDMPVSAPAQERRQRRLWILILSGIGIYAVLSWIHLFSA